MVNFISTNSGYFLKSFLRYNINTPLRIAHFLAQLAHESSDFTRKVENLNYAPKGLMNTSPFDVKLTRAQANLYGRVGKKPANQIMIANIGYANKNGNGNASSGDGWKYRGRGFIQLTGRGNYQEYKEYSGHDVVNNPDLLLNTEIAIDCSAWFFSVHKGLNSLADSNLIERITIIINGKLNGFSDRLKKFKFFKTQKITIESLKKKVNPRLQRVKPTSWGWFNNSNNTIFYKK